MQLLKAILALERWYVAVYGGNVASLGARSGCKGMSTKTKVSRWISIFSVSSSLQ